MLLNSLPTFNFLTPHSTSDSLRLRSTDFLSPIPLRIATDLRYKDSRRSSPTVGSQQDPTETPAISKKIALAEWLSSTQQAAAETKDPGSNPAPAFKSVGTRSVPSRPSIPGKHSKYSFHPNSRSAPARSHDEGSGPGPGPGSGSALASTSYGKPFRTSASRRGVPRSWQPNTPPGLNPEAGPSSLEDGRETVLGNNGVAYRVPGAPFEFQYSYTETPKVRPLALREAAFVPFGPQTMPRPWTGRAPLPPSKKKLPEFDSFKLPPPNKKGVKHIQPPGPFVAGQGPKYVKTREEILGEPLTREEIRQLVDSSCHTNRQLNIGRDGLTHNMLENIHHHWKRRRVCKIKCKGVATVDMDNVCHQLEEKTGGKIIHRAGGAVYLFRGRNYNYKTRPMFPLMLWKPAAAVYPRLIERAPGGLTFEEAKALRKRGRSLLPICKLSKNGVYLNLAKDVRDAFEVSDLVRVNCEGLNPSDFKKIGAKLKDLVPCVLLSFENEHILMWRGKDWKSIEQSTGGFEDNSGSECSTSNAVNDTSSTKTSFPSDDKNGAECLVSAPTPIKENMLESICTLIKDVDEALVDTDAMPKYLEKSSELQFSVTKADASVNGEVEYCHGKLDARSSKVELEPIDPIESSKMEVISDEELDSIVPIPATNPDIECVGQDSLYGSQFSDVPFFYEDKEVVNAGLKQTSEDGDASSNIARNEVSFSLMVPTANSSMKSTKSYFAAAETSVMDDELAESTEEQPDVCSEPVSEKQTDGHESDGMLVEDGMFDEVDANEFVVDSTTKIGQQERVSLDIEVLWKQAIDSGRVLLLDEPVLDPDIIHEKAIMFTRSAPPGPFFKRNFSPQNVGKQRKIKTNEGEGCKPAQSNNNDGRENLSLSCDDAPRGKLPLDELARLLAS